MKWYMIFREKYRGQFPIWLAGMLTGLLLLALQPTRAQGLETQEEEPSSRSYILIISGQVTRVPQTGQKTITNGAAVLNGYASLKPESTTGVGVSVLSGGLRSSNLIYFGIGGVHYFGSTLGSGFMLQADAGLGELYGKVLAVNTAPELGFGASASVGYSLEIARSFPKIQISVVQELYLFKTDFYPAGLRLGIVF